MIGAGPSGPPFVSLRLLSNRSIYREMRATPGERPLRPNKQVTGRLQKVGQDKGGSGHHHIYPWPASLL
jgi:hypothetical protein